MAKGKKTGGRDFKPGQSGNPNGRPMLPPEVKEAKASNANEVTLVLTRLLKMNREELSALANNKAATSMEILVASILNKAIGSGDYVRASFLFDRAFGKVPDEHNFNGSIHSALVQAMRGMGETK